MSAYRVPPLPILNNTNKAQYSQWHTYIERVYGSPIVGSTTVDLNTFNWFYWFAPFDPPIYPRVFLTQNGFNQHKKHPYSTNYDTFFQKQFWYFMSETKERLQTKSLSKIVPYLTLQPNDAFVGKHFSLADTNRNLRSRLALYGFCVYKPLVYYRAHLTMNTLKRDGRIEVLHVTDEVRDGKTAWFYSAVGSGVFLNVTHLQPRVRVIDAREQLSLFNRCRSYDEVEYLDLNTLPKHMQQTNIELLIMRQSANNPVPEMILHTSKCSLNKKVCCVPPSWLSTGHNKQRTTRCSCDNRFGLLHCVPPVWLTTQTNKLYSGLVFQAPTKHNTVFEASAYNTWIPIQFRWGGRTLHTILTLFGYALMFCQTDDVKMCINRGATLNSVCPANICGIHDDRLTVAIWLHKFIEKQNSLVSATHHHRTKRKMRRQSSPMNRFCVVLKRNLNHIQSNDKKEAKGLIDRLQHLQESSPSFINTRKKKHLIKRHLMK